MKRLSTLLLAMVVTAASAAIYPSSDWFGTNVQKQTTAAGVRAALGITSTGGSATNVYFTSGQSTTPRVVSGSNTFDVTGTLTNYTRNYSAGLSNNAADSVNVVFQSANRLVFNDPTGGEQAHYVWGRAGTSLGSQDSFWWNPDLNFSWLSFLSHPFMGVGFNDDKVLIEWNYDESNAITNHIYGMNTSITIDGRYRGAGLSLTSTETNSSLTGGVLAADANGRRKIAALSGLTWDGTTLTASGGSGSATNVFFTAGQSTTPRVVGGSNTFDVVGTLTNNTTGNAATATLAVNATDADFATEATKARGLLDTDSADAVTLTLTKIIATSGHDYAGSGSGLTNVPSKWFDSIAAMTNSTPVSNLVVHVWSYFGTNWEGGGVFAWENSSATADLGRVFYGTSGRWRRIDTGYPTNVVLMEWFGVQPNATIDQSAAAQAAINATPVNNGECILPQYPFSIGTSLLIDGWRGNYFGSLSRNRQSGYRYWPVPVCVINWVGTSGGTNIVVRNTGHTEFARFGIDTRKGVNDGTQWPSASGLLMDVDMDAVHSTTTSANVFNGLYFRERGTNSSLVGLQIAYGNWQNCEFFRLYDCNFQGGGGSIPEYWISVTNNGAAKAIQVGGGGGGQNSFQHYMFNCGFDHWQYNLYSSGANWEIDACKSTAAGVASYYINGDHPSIIRFCDNEGDRQFLVSPSMQPVTLIGNRIADATGMSVANIVPVDARNLIAIGNYFQHEANIPSITNSFTSTGLYFGMHNSFDTTNDAQIASWKFGSSFSSHGDFETLNAHNNIQSGPWKTPSATQTTNVVIQRFTDSTASTMALTMMPSNGVFGVGSYLNNVHFGVYNPDLTKNSMQFGDSVINPRLNLIPSSSGLITEMRLLGSNSVWLELYSGSGSTATRLDLVGSSAVNKIVARTGSLKITGTNDTDLLTFGTDYKIKFPYDTNFEVVGPIQGNSMRVTNFLTLFTNDNQSGISAAPTRYGQMTHFNSNGVEHVKVATTSGALAWASTNVVPLTSAQVVNKFTGTPTGSLFLRDDGTLAAPSVGGVAWGAISGTLSSQTDLENRLVGTTNAGNLAFLDAPNQFSKTNAFDALRATNLNQGASSAIVGWNSESKLLTTNSVTLPGSKVDLSAYSDTYLLYNNAGGIDVLPQSTFLSTPLGVTNNATLSSGFLVGGDGARGVTNVAVGSGLSLSGGTLSATSTGGGGFGTNTAAASSWTNSANHVWSGNNTFTSTLIAGSLQSTLDGSATIWDHTSFAGASAGQELFDAFAIAGNKVFGIQSQPNDVQQPTNIFFRVDYPTKQKYGLGSFATNYIANANTAGYTNSRAAPGIGGTNNMVARVVGTSGTLEFYNRSGEYGVTVCGVGVFTNTISSSTWHIPIPVNSGFIIRSGVGVDIQVYAQ